MEANRSHALQAAESLQAKVAAVVAAFGAARRSWCYRKLHEQSRGIRRLESEGRPADALSPFLDEIPPTVEAPNVSGAEILVGPDILAGHGAPAAGLDSSDEDAGVAEEQARRRAADEPDALRRLAQRGRRQSGGGEGNILGGSSGGGSGSGSSSSSSSSRIFW